MTIVKDKRLTRTDCDKAGDYVVPNVLSPRDLVFRPDIGQKNNCTTTDWDVKPQPKQTKKSSKMKCVVQVLRRSQQSFSHIGHDGVWLRQGAQFC